MVSLSELWSKMQVLAIAAVLAGCTVVNVTVTDGDESASDGEEEDDATGDEGSTEDVSSGPWTSGNYDTEAMPGTSGGDTWGTSSFVWSASYTPGIPRWMPSEPWPIWRTFSAC